ncbi:MAG TPA: Jag N-terminal domain-containing protein [Candidatus Eisenbacteria bacterium]|nr:Jag N-terminal domain-containing protein [Candidatus Eisenbacteria bacterium]
MVELEYAEALGITVDEAIKNALEILGADPDEVEVQVLEKGHRSFLGLGKSNPYRVRVSWREDLDEEVIEEEVPVREARPSPPPAPAPAPRRAEAARRPESPRRAEPSRPPEPPRRPEAPKAVEAPVRQPALSPSVPTPKPAPSPTSDSSPEIADRVRQLLRQMGFDAAVETEIGDDEWWVRIRVEDEEDAFLLHGRRGETRAALQHLLQRILTPRAENGPSVLVDINQQWEQRLEELRTEALDLARRAGEEGRAFRTRPLPSEERRIVHRALADRSDVRTHSEGDGREKRVVISPAQEAEPS